MLDDIRCRGGLNIVRDSEVTCGSVPQHYVRLCVHEIALSCICAWMHSDAECVNLGRKKTHGNIQLLKIGCNLRGTVQQ